MLVQATMIFILGFITAALLLLLCAPIVWRRAGERKAQAIFKTTPMTEAEINAGRDQLRASHAIEVRRIESQLEQVKAESTKKLVELNRKDMDISSLKHEQETFQAQLVEKDNHIHVLQHSLQSEVPRLQERAERLVWLLTEKERELEQLILHGGAQEQPQSDVNIEALEERAEQIRLLRNDLVEETQAHDTGRTLIEQSEGLLEENLELNGMLIKLQTKVDRLEAHEQQENSVLRQELQKISDIIIANHGRPKQPNENITAIQSRYGHYGDLHENHEDQILMDLRQGKGARPRFIERAAQAAKPQPPSQRPTVNLSHGSVTQQDQQEPPTQEPQDQAYPNDPASLISTVQTTKQRPSNSLSSRIESLMKKSAK